MAQEVGFVKSVKDFLVYLDGLPTARINELVENDQGLRGLVNALSADEVEVLMLDEGNFPPGQMFRRAGQKLTVPIGEFLLGRAVNPLGMPIDGRGLLAKTKTTILAELDQTAPDISAREFINEQFTTGITLIDSLIPIGKGQRELLLGDPRSGKTEFLVNTILNQQYHQTICVYASIGKPIQEVKNLIEVLTANQALFYTVIIAAASSDPAPLIYLTPQTAFTVAEYFQKQGRDVLIILDDLGNHAKIYREISLLGDRSPGRESYPGDIFYQHSHLLERAGKFKKEAGGGSITALPVMELNLGDFTTLIPTNLMSMTDGHILFKSALHLQGQRPAADISFSVTRVGSQTQNPLQNRLATHIKQLLTQAGQIETASRFSSELPFSTQLLLKQKEQIHNLLQQPSFGYIPKEIQTILLVLPFTGLLQKAESDFGQKHQAELIRIFSTDKELVKITKTVFTLKNELELVKLIDSVSGRIIQLILGTPPSLSPVKQVAPARTPPKKKGLLDKLEKAVHLKGEE